MGKGPIEDPHPQSAQLAHADLATLQQALDAGETTSTELTETLLARIAAIDTAGPRLRAVLAVDAQAVGTARDRDAERASGAVRGPLHGIPVLIKDNLDTAGLASTAGSLALASAPPDRDATVVARAA